MDRRLLSGRLPTGNGLCRLPALLAHVKIPLDDVSVSPMDGGEDGGMMRRMEALTEGSSECCMCAVGFRDFFATLMVPKTPECSALREGIKRG